MRHFLCVCRNVIAANNKAGWADPAPPIRVSTSASGKAVARGFDVAICDARGAVVATLRTSPDGTPLLKCGAKVVIETLHPPRVTR